MRAAISTYEDFHKARFDYLVLKSKEVCPDPTIRVLDIGRSYLTLRLLAHYDDVSTLGFPLERQSFTGIDVPDGPRRWIRSHITYDLNAAQTLTPIPTDDSFDLIVFAEVIEHLHTAPEITLFALKHLMRPGAIMIVQTPNAAALHKRLLLLSGRNPYEEIRVDMGNPGHFREYTKRELIAYAGKVGLDVVGHDYQDYFGMPNLAVRLLYKAAVALVPAFARGQTIVLRRQV